MDIKTPGIHHIGLRCKDIGITKNFYNGVLGFPLVVDKTDFIVVEAGTVLLLFKKAEPRDSRFAFFSPFELGLDHMALCCESEEELRRVAAALAEAKVENTGVKLDPTFNRLYVAFKDPDRIQWEFYMK